MMTQPFGKFAALEVSPTGNVVGGRYELVGRLGEGGMGQVYRARHVGLGKVFALKIIAPAFADDTAARARFNQEAKLASEISHPNIVSVVDYGEDIAFGAYMVMELVEGESLCPNAAPLSVRRACDVLGQIADALDHVHKRGIVHADVKAENIMLVTETTGARRRHIARLLDFGLARRLHDAGEHPPSGSPHYMAPERVMGGPVSASADVYALGVLGYVMLTGTLPFDGSLMNVLVAQISQVAPRMSDRRGEQLDEALEALIARAMAKDPQARHPSAAAFRYELNTVMHMLGMQKRMRQTSQQPAVDARAVTLAEAFAGSALPQALVSAEGDIALANGAFAKLVGRDALAGVALAETSLAAFMPDLVRQVRRVHLRSKHVECRARVERSGKPALDVVVWLSPLALEGAEVQLIARVCQIAEPRPPLVRRRR